MNPFFKVLPPGNDTKLQSRRGNSQPSHTVSHPLSQQQTAGNKSMMPSTSGGPFKQQSAAKPKQSVTAPTSGGPVHQQSASIGKPSMTATGSGGHGKCKYNNI